MREPFALNEVYAQGAFYRSGAGILHHRRDYRMDESLPFPAQALSD
jgi:hypothetical protein